MGRQQELPLRRGRGGPDRNQGRKKTKFDYVPHTARDFLDRRHPVHVTTKVVEAVGTLRGAKLWAAVRRAFVFGCVYGESDRKATPRSAVPAGAAGKKARRVRFRIVHFSVQGRHIHLVCEAASRKWLSRGIQGFKIRLAKSINKALNNRRGKVFTDRYHERVIKNPTQCRNTLAYVLNNARHHAYEEGATFPRNKVDPYSSAMAFDGWSRRVRPWGRAPRTDTDGEPTTAAPTIWLLRTGWRKAGETLSPNHIPGLGGRKPNLPQWS